MGVVLLADLIKEMKMNAGERIADVGIEITGLTSDSRTVRSGYLFAAFSGYRQDGSIFIDDAIACGAVAVLARPECRGDGLPADFPFLADDNPRRSFARMAARFYDLQPGTVSAVTGTNGKTSACWFARQIWEGAGCKAASLGTLGVVTKDGIQGGSLTTPDPVALHETLAALSKADVQCLTMEASSHGLDQYRLDGVRIGIGAFTNFSRDHLDYHGTMADYLAAKLRLFTEVMAPGGVVVLNADIPECATIEGAARAHGHRVLTYGWKGSDVRLLNLDVEATGQALKVEVAGRTHDIRLPLVGGFQVMNALCALGMVMASERAEAGDLVRYLATLKPVPGRMEHIGGMIDGGEIYVDYAHTPDALRNVLEALRPHTNGQLSVVFGCGGDRDTGKRAEMGKVATELADRMTVTDDNPRSEDPAAIRAAVLKGCPGAQNIGDRKEAIKMAVGELGEGDVLVVAGKGHETGQIVGDTVLPFDDAEVIRSVLKGGQA